MKGEWCYFQGHFSPETCERILALAQRIPDQQAVMGKGGDNKDLSHRRSRVRFIQVNDPDFQFLFDEIWRLGLVANRDWFNFHITNLSYIQLAEYDASYEGKYDRHHDVFWMNGDPHYHRKLTVIVQLSDPAEYEGGDFELFDLGGAYPDKQAIRTQGTVFVFPSFLPHALRPVTRGRRHSLAVWFDGPKWR